MFGTIHQRTEGNGRCFLVKIKAKYLVLLKRSSEGVCAFLHCNKVRVIFHLDCGTAWAIRMLVNSKYKFVLLFLIYNFVDIKAVCCVRSVEFSLK
jgi:hypothetical protein